MKVRDRYSVSQKATIPAWLRHRSIMLAQAVPDLFARPHRSDVDHVLICGCGHSGTTLLAAKLGQHSRVLLIERETGTFEGTVSAHCARRILTEWDYFARKLGKAAVVEKTPKHVQFIGKIRRILPESKLVFVCRNPLDNIASLYLRFKDLDACIGRWNADNRAVLANRERPGTHLVRYEDLVSAPREQISGLLGKLGFEWEPEILDPGRSTYATAGTKGTMAVRARQVQREITRNTGGWRKVFSQAEAETVIGRTRAVAGALGYPADLADYDRYDPD